MAQSEPLEDDVGSQQHRYMRMAIEQARKSPPKPTNFCVGALLVDEAGPAGAILASGYTLELPGNTHAEQCCFQKIAQAHGIPEDQIGNVIPATTVLYTTMEPCVERLSGNLPCLERVLRITKGGGQVIRKVYTGVKEPSKFVNENNCEARLKAAGIEQIHVTGFEDAILAVATAGHEKQGP
ncbi:hypothetical protein FH972_021574 [Carpinus fangiana]|uniref:CMP/dCMP-type deaminase domain-containing protein n=1 Tax=Carpinus fangiana TaxID=176857 RepID=A0A5N6KQ28_9ROSI|nr:hypothetical protein FH972_021574 [Carpinus fangiana]